MLKRTVWLGRCSSKDGISSSPRWAVRVGDHDWYEIDIDRSLRSHRGDVSRSGIQATLTAGTTVKSSTEIEEWNRKFVEEHQYFNVMGDNCQLYAHDLIQWLTDSVYDTPYVEAGVGVWTHEQRTIHGQEFDDITSKSLSDQNRNKHKLIAVH